MMYPLLISKIDKLSTKKVIYDNEYLMNNAFYKNKIPFYNEKLKSDSNYQKINDRELLEELNKFIKDNSIKYFLAFNVKFDYNSINNLYEKVGAKNEFKKLSLIKPFFLHPRIKKFDTLYTFTTGY